MTDVDGVKALIAAHYINRRHVLSLRTQNPVHAWAAYRVARTLRVAVPAWVLDVFDGWAATLTATTHGSAKAIADALGIGKKGGPLVTEKAANELHDLEIVAEVLDLLDHPTRRADGLALAKTYRRLNVNDVIITNNHLTTIMDVVASRHGLSYDAVKTICYRMIPALKRRAKSHG